MTPEPSPGASTTGASEIGAPATEAHAPIAQSHILVAGLAKDCGASLRDDVLRLRAALDGFRMMSWLVVESDSVDETVSVLQALNETMRGFTYLSLGRSRDRWARLERGRRSPASSSPRALPPPSKKPDSVGAVKYPCEGPFPITRADKPVLLPCRVRSVSSHLAPTRFSCRYALRPIRSSSYFDRANHRTEVGRYRL
jgi:hypothetical protein